MESSDSDDEEDRVSVRSRHQMDRLAREDDYFRFISDLNEEDYILMRDNNLLGPLGESTEEELRRRLQLFKENLRQNSDENTDVSNASDDESKNESQLDWPATFGQTENVTSEQRENQSWIEEIQISANSDGLRFGLEIIVDFDDETSNLENEYVASAKLPRREDTEDSQRQVENPQSESLFTRPSASEQDSTETLMEAPPTRSQRRLRCRSPVCRRTRARTDSWSPPHSQWEFFESINEDIPSQTFIQPLVSENERFSRPEHEETLRQQMPGHELQNRGVIETSKTRNAIHGECYSDTACSSESWEVRETNPTTPFNLEVGGAHCQACSQRDSRVSRIQLTSDSPNNTTIYVNTIRNPIYTILNIIYLPTQNQSSHTMTGFNNSSDLMDSDSNLEHSVLPPSENMERAESPNESHEPSGSARRPGSASNANYDSDSDITLTSDSSSSYMSSSSSSSVLISSSSDEYSENSSLILEDSEERTSSTSISETSQEDGQMTPNNLNQFHFINDPVQPTGLTESQINNLPLKSFSENDAFKVCCICFTEYTTGNMLRILPCTHEYHCQCIDRWLAEHSTCPICRGPVVDDFETDNE